MKYEKIISLGKIDYNNSGRKNCEVTLDIQLTYDKLNHTRESIYHNKKYAGEYLWKFFIRGAVWNPRKTYIYFGGQCQDTISQFFKHDKHVQRIIQLWNRYHLNDMQAGCAHQQTGNCDCKTIMNQYCEYGCYKYGSKWLYKQIPESVLDEIISIIKWEKAA